VLIPQDPNFESRVRESFSRQTIMHTIGATLTEVAPGAVTIELPYRADLCQQNGFLHAGVVTIIADSSCGYAAFSLMPNDADVLTVEFKMNLMSPAIGDRFLARGRVVKAGRTITVCTAEVVAIAGAVEKTVALMQATIMQRPNA
jgi:uncharacterized protein (TIGR00369 family)